MGYTRDALKGISWIGGLSVLTKTVGFIEILILARILAPAQFGAYSIAFLALGLLETLTETGVNIVLMQENKMEKYLSSAWIVSIVRGIIITSILLISASFVSTFFKSPDVLNLLYLISIVPLLRGFINPSIVKFQKELMFGKNFSFRSAILIFDTLISIGVTYLLKDPIGIVIGIISGVILELVLSFVVVKPLPSFNFNKKYVRNIFHKGKWITGSSIFDYLFSNIDNIAVGRLLGPASLGIYQIAYSLSVMPLTEISKVLVHVTVPVFIRISNDKNRLRKAFLKTLLGAFFISFPPALLIILFPQFFVFILGEKWVGISPVLPILAVVGFVKSFSILSSAVFIGVNKQSYITAITFISIIIFALTIVPFVERLELVGAGISALLSIVVSIPITAFYLARLMLGVRKASTQ